MLLVLNYIYIFGVVLFINRYVYPVPTKISSVATHMFLLVWNIMVLEACWITPTGQKWGIG